MNSFKTELFKISFNPRQSMVGTNDDVIRAHVTITHEKSEDYGDFFTLAALCIEVDELLQWGKLDATEAIKIIRKSASFFILNGE
jgi:hypothetical protein